MHRQRRIKLAGAVMKAKKASPIITGMAIAMIAARKPYGTYGLAFSMYGTTGWMYGFALAVYGLVWITMLKKRTKLIAKKNSRYLGRKFIFNGRDALGDALGDLTVAKGDFLVGNYYETLD